MSMKYVFALLACMPFIAAQANQTAENPFDTGAASSSQQKSATKGTTPSPQTQSNCTNLPRTCAQARVCSEARRALKCGVNRLDRDKDGVPCESLCR
ncbi:MAG: excalibur calcium-binding domain-containing protein [Pseudomonadota bacterium]|nr:excalibur calcium-binding domain-containing protein [Pseudomonadota bacterium]